MAITLQLSSASPKAVLPGASAGPVASPAGGDAAQGQTFALMIDDLLKPAEPAAQGLPITADTATSDVAADPAVSVDASTDAATQALLASLLVSQGTVAPPAAPAAAASALPEDLDGTLPQLAQLQATLVDEAALPAKSAAPATPQLMPEVGHEVKTPSLAFALPPEAAGADKKLPEAAAKLAAPVVDSRLLQNTLGDVGKSELPVATAAPDAGQLRPSAPVSAAPLAATGPTTVAQYSIPEPVAGNRWADALGQRALFMVDQQVKSAELHLNPPNLGPLEVKLALDGDKASLSFTTNQAAVREAVQQSLPRLHQVFADNGTAGLNVQVHRGQQQQPQQQERSQAQGGQADKASGGQDDRPMSVQSARWHSQSYATARGGVDVFA